MKASAAIAEILRREGTEILFGYPVNPLFDAAADADIRTVVVRQERTGIHMADAYSRVHSGKKIGVFTMQHGPGAENAFGAIAQAFGDSVPILVIAAGYPRHVAQLPPNFRADAYRPIAKWVETVPYAPLIPDAMRRAFARLRGGRPRPVVLEVPVDVFYEDVPEPIVYESPRSVRTGPDPSDVSRAAAALRQAERPLIYAGQGVHYAAAWNELRELAELLQAPVTTSLQGKSAFPEDHPLALGSGGRAVPGAVKSHLEDADVVFAIGASLAYTFYGIQMPRDRVLVHATADPDDLHNDIAAQLVVVGDAQLVLQALTQELKADPGPHASARGSAVTKRISTSRAAWMDEWRPLLTSDEVPLSPYRVINELMRAVDLDRTIVTHDAGSPRDQLSPFWPSRKPLTYLGWGKTTQLGYGLGLAMGAKLARPDHLCINVWGDAAIGMTGMDLETAARERIPIMSVLLNNFCMAIELPVMPKSTEKYRATDISGNYADLASSLGLYAERITQPDEIASAIERGIEQTEQGVPVLLEFITAKELRFPS